MSTIETAGALRPGTTNTPLDQRSRVNTLAEISTLSLPYLGQIVYCLETDRYYKVTALKSTQVGALTVADAAVDSYEALPVTTAELQSLIVTQVTSNPTILTFLEELIAARIAESGESGTEEPDDTETLPYTYPEGAALTQLAIDLPAEHYYYGAGTADSGHLWSDDDVLTVSATIDGVSVGGTVTAYDGTAIVTGALTFQTAGSRAAVQVSSPVGNVRITFYHGGTAVKTSTYYCTGYHVPRYFTRPAGQGAWQLKINGTAVEAEYWTGSAWADFPSGGLTADYAGSYVRPKTEPTFPSLACWSNSGADGDQFLYIV